MRADFLKIQETCVLAFIVSSWGQIQSGVSVNLFGNTVGPNVTFNPTYYSFVEAVTYPPYDKTFTNQSRQSNPKYRLPDQLEEDEDPLIEVDPQASSTARIPLVGECYTCSTLSSGRWCMNVSDYEQYVEDHGFAPPDVPDNFVTTCSQEQKYCQVAKVEYRIGNSEDSIWSLERNCTDICRPFCVTMGARTKVTYCTSCCRWDGKEMEFEGNSFSGNRCNVDSGSLGLACLSSPYILLSLLAIQIVYSVDRRLF